MTTLTLSAQLPTLATADNRIVVAPTGQPIRLRGVNRSGLEYAPPAGGDFLAGAGISRAEIRAIVADWGANVIRLPFNQDRVLTGGGEAPAAAYLDALDTVVGWAAELGAYTILDLQWRDAATVFGLSRDGCPNRVPPLPDAGAIDAWRILAARYRNEPAVLFDLFNEPHDPIRDADHPDRDDAQPLWKVRDPTTLEATSDEAVSMRDWQRWARLLTQTIRSVHADALIFVSGIDWGYDLRGMPLTVDERSSEPIPNLVYSTHVYPWRGGPSRTGGWSMFMGRTPTWRRAFGDLAARVPVFAGEWGGHDDHLEWGRALCDYMDVLGMGWTAWSWTDRPRLVTATVDGHEATPFGGIVRGGLSG